MNESNKYSSIKLDNSSININTIPVKIKQKKIPIKNLCFLTTFNNSSSNSYRQKKFRSSKGSPEHNIINTLNIITQKNSDETIIDKEETFDFINKNFFKKKFSNFINYTNPNIQKRTFHNNNKINLRKHEKKFEKNGKSLNYSLNKISNVSPRENIKKKIYKSNNNSYHNTIKINKSNNNKNQKINSGKTHIKKFSQKINKNISNIRNNNNNTITIFNDFIGNKKEIISKTQINSRKNSVDKKKIQKLFSFKKRNNNYNLIQNTGIYIYNINNEILTHSKKKEKKISLNKKIISTNISSNNTSINTSNITTSNLKNNNNNNNINHILNNSNNNFKKNNKSINQKFINIVLTSPNSNINNIINNSKPKSKQKLKIELNKKPTNLKNNFINNVNINNNNNNSNNNNNNNNKIINNQKKKNNNNFTIKKLQKLNKYKNFSKINSPNHFVIDLKLNENKNIIDQIINNKNLQTEGNSLKSKKNDIINKLLIEFKYDKKTNKNSKNKNNENNLINKKIKLKFSLNNSFKSSSKIKNSNKNNNKFQKLQTEENNRNNEHKDSEETIRLNTQQNLVKRNFKQENPNSYLNISNSSILSTMKDSNYYNRESETLSKYIKEYYETHNKYPETNLSFYKFGRIIGKGAFGKVNLGLNLLTGRIVAIKSFNKQNIISEISKRKILYETNLMRNLHHKSIVKILETFESEKYILIIMEYISGGNLQNFVKKRRKLTEKTAKILFKQIIEGIQYIHSQGIVHRDIKLENILLDLNNNIKICDFGVGKIIKPESTLYDQCGTPVYMAPEIIKNAGYKGFPVDIWSSGVALYIMLTGNIPFNRGKIHDLQYNIVNKDINPIEGISNEAKNLIEGLLNKDPNKRLTAEDILNHPWLNNIDDLDTNGLININKYHLFTNAEMILLSKTHIDYRKAQKEELNENFTLKNLFTIDNKNNENNKTKSVILAPYNSMLTFYENMENSMNRGILDKSKYSSLDNFKNEISIHNSILKFGGKVKEFNVNYELNNNEEIDNGMLINSKNSECFNEDKNNNNNNNSKLNIKNNDITDSEIKNNCFIKIRNVKDKNGLNNVNTTLIVNELFVDMVVNLGYNKEYVLKCLENNELNQATTAYYLFSNYQGVK